jgi:hypothetical protein
MSEKCNYAGDKSFLTLRICMSLQKRNSSITDNAGGKSRNLFEETI